MLERRALRLGLGIAPFALIGVTLVAFLVTRDPAVFSLAGILAAIYVLAFFLLLRRGRNRRLSHKQRGGRRRKR